VLGPHAAPADGEEDLVFTGALLDALEASYCVDTERIFATGHSWGGDMAAVVACFLGERITAAAPVAANRPYWFEPQTGEFSCEGEAAVWTFFGVADDHFTWQAYPGEFGDEQDAFWQEAHGCASEGATALDYGLPASGHQTPSYFSEAAMAWFTGF